MKSRADEPTPGHVPFDSLEQEAFLNLWRTYDRLKALDESLFAEYGLTAQQYNALRILWAKHPEPLPTLGIGSRLVSRAPDITRLIDKLEDRRLVERRRDSTNRRVVYVAITAAGIKLLEELTAPLTQCHQSQLGHLSAEELHRLIELLKLARLPHEGRPV